MQSAAKKSAIFGLVLAAGRAERYGATKQLAPVGGVPMVSLAAAAARKAFGERTLLVVGHDWRAVAAAGDDCRYCIVNDRYREGIGTSIVAGVRAVRHVAGAVVIMLADQPGVDAAGLGQLVDEWSGANDQIVASAYAGTVGPPALFPRAAFDALVCLTGDRGARSVIESGAFRVSRVVNESAAVDVDTLEDLERLAQPTERDAGA